MLIDLSSLLTFFLHFPAKPLKCLYFSLETYVCKNRFFRKTRQKTDKQKNKSRIICYRDFENILPEKLKYKHGARTVKWNGYQESQAFCTYEEKIRPIWSVIFRKVIKVFFLFSNSIHKIQIIILLLLLAVSFQRICLSECHAEE